MIGARRLTVALVCFVGLTSLACSGMPDPRQTLEDLTGLDIAPDGPGPMIRPVRTLVVEVSGGATTRSFTGTTRAGDEARLSFKVAGSVKDVHINVGDKVEAGALIAELDAIDFQLQVQQLDAAVAQATAQARNAKANYDRVRELFVADNASRAELDGARAASDSAAASVASVRQQRALARQQLGYARITATVEASVAEVLVNEGENVAAGQPVVILSSGARPEVVFGVPAALIQRVTEGMDAKVVFSALKGAQVDGTVTEVGVSSSAATTYPVTARLLGDPAEVRPGMAAEVTISFPPLDDRTHIRVPPVAVGEDRVGRFVWVVEAAEEGLGTVHRRAVEIGELTSEGIDILSGLETGDVVVTAGVSRIREGLTVRLQGAGQ